MINPLPIEEAAKLALDNRLFVRGWCLQSYLSKASRGIFNYSSVKHISIWMDGKTPVGVAIVTTECDIQAYVKTSYRRSGVGSKLVADLKEKMGDRAGILDAGMGLKRGSLSFWKANNIRIY